MKRLFMTAVVLSCALAFMLAAQAQQAPKEHTMTGCLKAGSEAGTYMVTDVEGNGPKTIGIVSSEANLAPHVGHKIAVTGTAVPAKEAEADPKVPKAAHYMKLTSIKMVSTTCP
jgi:opacity protein-like surface antigen